MRVALVHDYLTQRGGAERVVLAMTRAFPEAPLYTSLYDEGGTFPEFAGLDIRTSPINALAPLRRHHRLALPLLARSFSRMGVTADVAICSSSGWAHGSHINGRKVVYCHTPARWLYQPQRYLHGRQRLLRATSALLRPVLLRWDKSAAASADRYLANSSVVAERIRAVYGLEAEILPPPPAVTPVGSLEEVEGVTEGFFLCVSRLLPYKNVDAIVEAFAKIPNETLVVAGTGPEAPTLRNLAGRNVTFPGRVTDPELRWLYANCSAVVAASHEDFGLTPVEAASFGRPVAALRWGGFLDTLDEGRTGVFFDKPAPDDIAVAIGEIRRTAWDESAIRSHADVFSKARFIQRLREIVYEEATMTRSAHSGAAS